MARTRPDDQHQLEEIDFNDNSSVTTNRIIDRFKAVVNSFRDKWSSSDELRDDLEGLNELCEQTCQRMKDEVSRRETAELCESFHKESVEVLRKENEKSRKLIDKLWDSRMQAGQSENSGEGGEEAMDADDNRHEQTFESMDASHDSERMGRSLRRSSIRVSRQRSRSADVLILSEKPYEEEQHSLVSQTHCFRALSTRMIYCAEGQDPNEKMFPRCKTLKPYLFWEKQVVPNDVDEESPNPPVQLLSRVYCNCGMPLTREDSECECPLNQRRRHKFFNRRNIYDFDTRSSPILLPDETPVKNVILSSLSEIDSRGAPTTFDIVAQISNLAVEKRPKGAVYEEDPPVIVSIWDGTIPPNFIGKERFLRDLKTDADKVVYGGSLPWDMPGMIVDVRLANVRKVESGEFVILRDVVIVMAHSVGASDGSLTPVWMLQARAMEVIRDTPSDPEILAAFLTVAKAISTCVILMGVDGEAMSEEIWEEENSFLAFLDARVKRKSTGGEAEGEPVSKRADMDGATAEPLKWIDELAAIDEVGLQPDQDRILSLTSTHGNLNLPPACFESFAENQAKIVEFMDALRLLQEFPRRHVWLCWMTTCHTSYTIREHTPSYKVCCKEGCEGGTSLYVHIPMMNSPEGNLMHLLIDAAHFRENKKPVPVGGFKRRKEENQIAEFERIVKKVNESQIVLHRAVMLNLAWKVVYVVSEEPEWITVTDR